MISEDSRISFLERGSIPNWPDEIQRSKVRSFSVDNGNAFCFLNQAWQLIEHEESASVAQTSDTDLNSEVIFDVWN